MTRPAPGLRAREERDGFVVHRLGLSHVPAAAATLAYVGLAARAVAALGDRLAIVHAHQLLSPATVALVARAIRDLPFVVTAHASGTVGDVASLERQGPLGRARIAALGRWAGAFVAVSAPIRDELLEAGIPERRIHRIPNGVDERRFAPAARAERATLRARLGLPPGKIAIYSGRLAPEKGADVLLDAWAEATRHRVRGSLVLLGDGPERPALEAQARAVGVADTVRFVGAVEDVATWLRAADAFVLPSRTEGLSVALLEAMACGLPVVATDVGGTREAAGEGALVVPPEDPQALAAALRETFTSADATRARGVAGRERVVARYGIAGVARRHRDLYERVAAAGRLRGGQA